MKKSWSLKLNNRGASLIAVLVSIAVVGMMGAVIMQLTITNIQMKEVERQGKTNFYSAEDMMGYLTNQISIQAAEDMQAAFNDLLAQYKTVSQTSDGLRSTFVKYYLDKMIARFGSEDIEAHEQEVDGALNYKVGYYKISKIQDCILTSDTVPAELKDSTKYGFSITAEADHADCAPYYYADYANGTFTLGGICVYAKDQFGNITKIKTDMVFHTPAINLEGSNVVKEFMRYSLIADDMIELHTTGISVDGNVYAGEGGIVCWKNSGGELKGKKIITRGDIQSYSNTAKFYIGKPGSTNYSQIWANNYVTIKDSAEGAKMFFTGENFVADDIEMNGKNDLIVIDGGYYGYNFQKNYSAPEVVTNSEYSSAIIINGSKATLDISKVTSLLVAGRSFIGRNKNVAEEFSNDILMGEALSVKSNQLAYYIPDGCIVDGVFNAETFQSYSNVPNVTSYLKPGAPYTEYHYLDKDGHEQRVFYLNFSSEQKANDYYYEFFNANKDSMTEKAKSFINMTGVSLTGDSNLYESLKLSTDSVALRGDFLRNDGSILKEIRTPIAADYWSQDKIYYNFAADHAIRYKSLCLTLEDKKDITEYANARVSSSDPTLYHNLIDTAQWNLFFEKHESDELMQDGKVYEKPETDDNHPESTDKIVVAIVDNEGGTAYPITDWDGGLVIASGDVNVLHNFRGTIISGGKITLYDATITSDEVLISTLISNDITLKNNALFAKIFKGYAESAEEVMSGSSIERYMTFSNWTKTTE